jgi:tRNA nucleotidyltransferase/poly(A) polymerase
MQHQFVCWVAGGAVRDIYLGREVYDFDLVTDATTETLKKIFPEAVLVGESFGVLKIPVTNGIIIDLATFRQESDYVDGRRPSAVQASTPLEDAKRRDFTINALFWDDENQSLIDYVGGVQDLTRKELKCVGDSEVRFGEDHLRIVRLIRFAAQLFFTIDSKTEMAAEIFLPQVKKVSGERIWIELKKIAQARHWKMIIESKLFRNFIAEVFEAELSQDFFSANSKLHHISKVDGCEIESLLFVLMNLVADARHVKNVLLQRLKLSRNEIAVFDLIQFALTELKENKSIYELCIEIEKKPGLKSVLLFLNELGFFEERLIEKCAAVVSKYPTPLTNGQQLKAILVGPEIGKTLEEIRLLQFQGKLKSEEEALDWVRKR